MARELPVPAATSPRSKLFLEAFCVKNLLLIYFLVLFLKIVK